MKAAAPVAMGPISSLDMIFLLTLNANGESTLEDLEFAYGVINDGEISSQMLHEIVVDIVTSLENRGLAKIGPSVARLTSKGNATAAMVRALDVVMDDMIEDDEPICNCPNQQSN